MCRVERGYSIFYTHSPLKQHDTDAKESFVFHELTIGAASLQLIKYQEVNVTFVFFLDRKPCFALTDIQLQLEHGRN